jgi:hypothetical protein
LESDLEHEWPVVPLAIRLALLPINLLSFGFTAWIVQRYASRGGDADIWPFRRHTDYQAALKRPPYLGGGA